MATGQQNLLNAIATKLRLDTGAGSLVELTGHSSASPSSYRISRDKPPKKGQVPFLGIAIYQSVPLSDDGPSEIQTARIHFRIYSTKELTGIQIADRIDYLLHARTEQTTATNVGHYDFSDSNISNRQTRWKNRDEQFFREDTDIWTLLVEADVIWVDEPCT